MTPPVAPLRPAGRAAIYAALAGRRNLTVIVCGGRDYYRRDVVDAALTELHERFGLRVVRTGCAAGADTHAAMWADRSRDIRSERFAPDWQKYGKAAGPIRNATMLDAAPAPDLVVAFPGGKGTADMVSRARRGGLPVWEVLT